MESVSDTTLATAIDRLVRKIDSLYEPLSSMDRYRQSAALLLGTDRQGRSIFFRAVYAIRVAVMVGTITGLASVLIGTHALHIRRIVG